MLRLCALLWLATPGLSRLSSRSDIFVRIQEEYEQLRIKHLVAAQTKSTKSAAAVADLVSDESPDESPNESINESPDESIDESFHLFADDSPDESPEESPDESHDESPDVNHNDNVARGLAASVASLIKESPLAEDVRSPDDEAQNTNSKETTNEITNNVLLQRPAVSKSLQSVQSGYSGTSGLTGKSSASTMERHSEHSDVSERTDNTDRSVSTVSERTDRSDYSVNSGNSGYIEHNDNDHNEYSEHSNGHHLDHLAKHAPDVPVYHTVNLHAADTAADHEIISDVFYDLGLDEYLEYTASLKVAAKQSDEPQNEGQNVHEVHVDSDEIPIEIPSEIPNEKAVDISSKSIADIPAPNTPDIPTTATSDANGQTVDVKVMGDVVEIAMTGRASGWFSFGFGSSTMDGAYAIMVHGDGVTEHILRKESEDQKDTALPQQRITILRDEVAGLYRTVVMSRARETEAHTFPDKETMIDIIAAKGTKTLMASYHGSHRAC